MKYCRHCGAENLDEAIICPKCGCALDVEKKTEAVELKRPKDNTFKMVAFVLCLLKTIITGLFILPLCWTIPMTISVYKAYKGERELSTEFKVCLIIFVDVLSGIFLLIDED